MQDLLLAMSDGGRLLEQIPAQIPTAVQDIHELAGMAAIDINSLTPDEQRELLLFYAQQRQTALSTLAGQRERFLQNLRELSQDSPPEQERYNGRTE